MTLAELSNKYYQLLFTVGNKYPGESRHETALRYIREREARRSKAGMADVHHAYVAASGGASPPGPDKSGAPNLPPGLSDTRYGDILDTPSHNKYWRSSQE